MKTMRSSVEETDATDSVQTSRASTGSMITPGFYRHRSSSTDLSLTISSSSMYDSCSSLSSHSTFFSSPALSPLSVKSVEFPELHFKVFKYRNKLDEAEKEGMFGNYNVTEDDIINLTRLDYEYLDRLAYMANELQTFCTVRLHEEDQLPKRRCSLNINGEIIANLKETDISSKMNPSDTLCGGHSPRDANLRFDYDIMDNNTAGEYPPEVKYTEANQGLLKQLKNEALSFGFNENIIEAKKFHDRLIVFTELVPSYIKLNNAVDGKKYCATGKSTPKHYFQEAESLSSIVDRMQKNIYQFINASAKHIKFIFRDQIFIVHLDQLVPIIELPANNHIIPNLESLALFILSNKIDQHHAPVYYTNETFNEFPVMNQSGANGYPITSDGDLEHICGRNDMPTVAYKIFRGRYDANEIFILGLKLLQIRLRATTHDQYCSAIVNIMSEYSDQSNLLLAYKDIIDEAFDPLTKQNYLNYQLITYYSKSFLPALDRTLAKYLADPKAIERIGVASIHTVVGISELDHPLSTHGSQSIHPGSNPGNFVPVAGYYNGVLIILGNELSYLSFLFHDRDILENHFIDVHPYWLDSSRQNGFLAKQWLDLIEIIALHKAACSKFEYNRYKKLVMYYLDRGRNCDQLALSNVQQVFVELDEFLNKHWFCIDNIKERIDMLYGNYAYNSSIITNEIHKIVPKKYPVLRSV